MKFNVGNFLKKHRALMTYLYDTKGFKRGIAISIPDDENKMPLIGWAMFDEVAARCARGDSVIVEHFSGNVFDIPVFEEALKEVVMRFTKKEPALNFRNLREIKKLPNVYIENIRYPFINEADPDLIKNCILLAYSRCNSNYQNYFIDDKDSIQSLSVMKVEGDDEVYVDDPINLKIAMKVDNYVKWEWLEENTNNPSEPLIDYYTGYRDIVNIRKKIKDFEYRAYRYYKYIEGYRSKNSDKFKYL